MTDVHSIDPRTGNSHGVVAQETTREEARLRCTAARVAFEHWRALPRSDRARALDSIAEALEQAGPTIVDAADAETALGAARLEGELIRTCFQLRSFAEVVRDGGYLEATIDHAGSTPMGPRPDLRRSLVPLGPVAVFGASNFPLAFSVPGGDTASALAAGCSVVVKAHESHPQTSELCAAAMSRGAAAAGASADLVQLVHGRDAGAALVQDPEIWAVGFTGSLHGGAALMALAAERPRPIPFYGELASLNPLVVTQAAAEQRGDEIADGLVGSFTLGAGQFCTKPGFVLVPRGEAGDTLVATAAEAVRERDGAVMLNPGIAEAFRAGVARLDDRAPMLARGRDGGPHAPAPTLFEVDASEVDDLVARECFGPAVVVVRHEDEDDLVQVLRRLPGSLTCTIHRGEGEQPSGGLLDAAGDCAGRIVFDAFPTGVAVSWAQQHGGPWPSTSTVHTSVGMTAVRRFLRPVVWQDAPQAVLPVELRDDAVDVPRRIDGVLEVAADV